MPGSSPRARGAPGEFGEEVRFVGLIPAGAGSTPRATSARSPTRAHPRGRGEHVIQLLRGLEASGSSPRARGAHRPAHGRGRAVRLIPAGAGSTSRCRGGVAARSAHPRGRGEHGIVCAMTTQEDGSSPRARGAQQRAQVRGEAQGLIPAGAGSTWLPRRPSAPARAHPRGRGEHTTCASSPAGRAGSSPRARGARQPLDLRTQGDGLIPAGAGSTGRASTGALTTAAHPRGRGEHSVDVPVTWPTPGSSPRARGARAVVRPAGVLQGLIPAGAGSTGGFVTRGGCCRAHPRGRGEHTAVW